jgi:hypothetical protein
MSTISAKTTREQLAAIVVSKLREHNINAVLVGGSVVSIYTNNKYESVDLDFISAADQKKIATAMSELGFTARGKDFVHPKTAFSVEFPSGPLAIGDDVPIVAEGKITVDGVDVVLLSPTQSVMDRLAWFFHDNDRQCLDQAIWIAQKHPVNLQKIREWAMKERNEDKLKIFLAKIQP